MGDFISSITLTEEEQIERGEALGYFITKVKALHEEPKIVEEYSKAFKKWFDLFLKDRKQNQNQEYPSLLAYTNSLYLLPYNPLIN